MAGRGRGRFRFGGSRDSGMADMLDETREDLGLSLAQMELLNAENGSALYPPLQLPQPEALTDRDAYLIQRQRVVAHKLDDLYHPWDKGSIISSTDPAGYVHITIPETQQPNEIFIPDELRSNTLTGIRSTHTNGGSNAHHIMKPRAFENVFKSLEAQEKAQKGGVPDPANDGDSDEHEEDLGDDNNDYTFDYYGGDSDGGGSDDGGEEVFY